MSVLPAFRSFLEIPDGHPFSTANLPYGVFRPAYERARPGVALGDFVIDLKVLSDAGLLDQEGVDLRALVRTGSLGPLMAAGPEVWKALRLRVASLLDADQPRLRDDEALRDAAVLPTDSVTMMLPTEIGDYTDFYSSRQHAENVGTMFRGAENALMPNWLHLPVGYHGRASSIIPSGSPVRRPKGQLQTGDDPPTFGPSRLLDFELEAGFFVGPGNQLGTPIPVESAHEHIFGFVLVNDWSARDIQRWEYVPLGPFLGKNFATTISPWVVPLEALMPYRVQGPGQNPLPLPYLQDPEPWTFDVALEVAITPADADTETVVCRSNMRHLYWNVRQQLAHHTSGGCNVRPGDLMASGTISGPDPSSFGSMLELSWRGTKPVELGRNRTRRFLEDGDRVTMRGMAGSGQACVGFGEAVGTVLPALER